MAKADVVNLFNAIVMATLPSRNLAPYFAGTVIGAGANLNSPNLGNPVEPDLTLAELLPNSDTEMTQAVYHALHVFAMKLTRVRMCRHTFMWGGGWYSELIGLTAFQPSLAIGFDMPLPVHDVQTTITIGPGGTVANFLVALSARVNAIRLDYSLRDAAVSFCHASCHGSCHGARARR